MYNDIRNYMYIFFIDINQKLSVNKCDLHEYQYDFFSKNKWTSNIFQDSFIKIYVYEFFDFDNKYIYKNIN